MEQCSRADGGASSREKRTRWTRLGREITCIRKTTFFVFSYTAAACAFPDQPPSSTFSVRLQWHQISLNCTTPWLRVALPMNTDTACGLGSSLPRLFILRLSMYNLSILAVALSLGQHIRHLSLLVSSMRDVSHESSPQESEEHYKMEACSKARGD